MTLPPVARNPAAGTRSDATADVRPIARSDWLVPGALALVAGLLYLVPGIAGTFGPFIDEHYYVACARRLAWGYVDHPPLGPALLRVAMAVGGETLFVLRLLAAALGAAAVLGTGLLAARLGAGRWGQGLASAAMLGTPVAQVIFGFYSMNAIEPLLWLALCWIAIELALDAHPRWWLAFGAVAGLALLNKHTVVTLMGALALGILVTPMRRQLASRWPWLGASIAAAMIVPHIAWQVHHGWPSLEFYRNAALYKNQPAGPLQVVGQQLLFIGPGTFPVWAAGLVFLWRYPGARLRLLAAAYGALLLMLIASQQSRPDRMLGVYPVLFAAGGVALGRLAASRTWMRVGAPAWLALTALILLPIGIPVLPPDATAAYAQALGAVPQLERGEGKRSALPQWFADRLGWHELVEEVAAIRDALPPDERRQAAILAPSYGQAGALEWLGEDRGLRPAYSTHNTYFLWGPPPGNPQVAIVIGDRRERLAEMFSVVELARVHDCDRCTPWRDDMPIWIVRGPKRPVDEQWAHLKHYE